jgi:protein-histidine pros-kinase
MTRWWRDTLFTRLFLLILLALVVSHLVAWGLVTRLFLPAQPSDGSPTPAPAASAPAPRPPLPTLGSLPPTPGLPGPLAAQPGMALPLQVLVLDYAIRIALIALFAWWGARWLVRPVRRMVAAARSLGDGVSRGQPPEPLDETQGTAEVREASAVFNQMAQRLAQEFRGRGLLMASISHDLRTPLTRMRIRLESLLPAPLAQRCIEDIREMNGLIDGAIGVFRAEDPHDEPLQATDVFALVQSLTDDLVETGHRVTLDGHHLVALCKPEPLRRAVSNLIGNALRYSGAAEVTVLALGGARILVEDRGPGIPEAHLQRVMEPFQRMDPSRTRDTGGTGLGLHIARSLLESQGATLHLRNRDGGGLRVEIRLPAAPGR